MANCRMEISVGKLLDSLVVGFCFEMFFLRTDFMWFLSDRNFLKRYIVDLIWVYRAFPVKNNGFPEFQLFLFFKSPRSDSVLIQG